MTALSSKSSSRSRPALSCRRRHLSSSCGRRVVCTSTIVVPPRPSSTPCWRPAGRRCAGARCRCRRTTCTRWKRPRRRGAGPPRVTSGQTRDREKDTTPDEALTPSGTAAVVAAELGVRQSSTADCSVAVLMRSQLLRGQAVHRRRDTRPTIRVSTVRHHHRVFESVQIEIELKLAIAGGLPGRRHSAAEKD